MKEGKKKYSQEELVEKYGLDLEGLKKDQLKLAGQLEIKDKIDFKLADTFGAVAVTFIENKILACIIVVNKDYELLDSAYVFERIKFPYITGFRNYREMESMMNAFQKLNERPDIFLVSGHGIDHPRLGLASHFGLVTGIPCIGVSPDLLDTEIKEDNILKKVKKVGRVLQSKENSNPLYISPGNGISIDSAYEVCKGLIKPPHKRPEPIHLASKYAKDVRKELVG